MLIYHRKIEISYSVFDYKTLITLEYVPLNTNLQCFAWFRERKQIMSKNQFEFNLLIDYTLNNMHNV